MAGVAFIKPKISVNGADWSPYVSSVTLNEMVEMVDTTTFGDDFRQQTSTGVHSGNFSGNFFGEWGTNKILTLLRSLVDGQSTSVQVILQRQDSADPGVNTDAENPTLTFNVAVSGYTLTAAMGQAISGNFTFPIVSKVALAEA